MAIDLGALPKDLATLNRLLVEPHAAGVAKEAALSLARTELSMARAEATTHRPEIEKLKVELACLRQLRFGRSSPRFDPAIAKLELMTEDAETAGGGTRGEDVGAAAFHAGRNDAQSQAGACPAAREPAARGDRACAVGVVPVLRRGDGEAR